MNPSETPNSCNGQGSLDGCEYGCTDWWVDAECDKHWREAVESGSCDGDPGDEHGGGA